MKSVISFFFILTSIFAVKAQSAIETANTCYSKQDYQCALTNYLTALNNNGYKTSDKYLVEYRIGQCYYYQVQDEKALEYYKKCLVSYPDYFYALWGVADCYANLKKNSDALEYYKKTLALATSGEDKQSINYQIGEIYYDQKQYNSAVDYYRNVYSRTGDYSMLDAFIGDAFYYLAKYDSALAYYQKSEPAYKGNTDGMKKLKVFEGRCSKQLGKKDEAMKYFDAAIALNPDYGTAYWEKGIVFAEKKEYPQAIEWYKKALSKFTPKDTSDNYTLMGNLSACYREQKNYAEQVNWLLKRKDFSKNKYDEYASVATIQYARLKKSAEAEKTCKEVIPLYQTDEIGLKKTAQSNYIKLLNIAGKIALEKKDTSAAKKYFDEALGLNKYSYEANAGAGEIAWNRQDKDSYKQYYNNISRSGFDTLLTSKKEIANVYGRGAYVDAYIDGESYYSSSVYSALLYDSAQKEAVLLWPILISNDSYATSQSKASCIAMLNKAAKQYSGDKEYVSNLYNSIAVLTPSTDTAAIRKALEEAVKIYPENIKPWDNLLKFYSSYDNAKGSVMVEKLIAILKKKKDNATTATAYIYKGDFLWRQDKKEEAKKAYQEALVWDSNNATAKDRVKLQ